MVLVPKCTSPTAALCHRKPYPLSDRQKGMLAWARLWVNGWGHALQIGFYNQRGELLLREISNGGALQKKARHFRPLPGGEYELKVSFEASPEEKIYGMGQYQQEVMNLPGQSASPRSGASGSSR